MIWLQHWQYDFDDLNYNIFDNEIKEIEWRDFAAKNDEISEVKNDFLGDEPKLKENESRNVPYIQITSFHSAKPEAML